MTDFWLRPLSRCHRLILFGVAVFLFAWPLILADHLYLDDNLRALSGGMIWQESGVTSQESGMTWQESGRLWVELFYQGLSFSSGMPDVFPLPLVLAMVLFVCALDTLVMHLFQRSTAATCLVVLPLWYSPFFLQNLSYHYDGPTTAFGVAAAIYAITFRHRSMILRQAVAGLLMALGLGFYQMVINVYIGLCCVELIREVDRNLSLRRSLLLLLDQCLKLTLGVLIYVLTAYQFTVAERKALRVLDGDWLRLLSNDLLTCVQHIALLVHDGNRWLIALVLALAACGFCLSLYRIFKSDNTFFQRLMLSLICLIALAVAFLAIPGLALVFRFFDSNARLMMGMSTFLVLVFYLSRNVLVLGGEKWGLLLLLPLLAMLAFSYAYGRVLTLQKELENSVVHYLSYELITNERLSGIEHVQMVNNFSNDWYGGAEGAMKIMPALRYVLNVHVLLQPELLSRSGVIVPFPPTQSFDWWGRQQQGERLIENRFYSVYLQDKTAVVVMKDISADGRVR
ncbi:glucosyltransferase domain-containing protein [Pseudomonas sp.]|uniref:glucosyltransferase domain-containing protein n=1 Tax=Pseudomonas sp. TaxID=306 RepID=UPI003FD700DC